MENYFKKILNDDSITPPETISRALHDNFKNPVWIEWFIRGDQYEAIFYADNTEHIALLDKNGILLSFRINLPSLLLPLPIADQIERHGELMNSILQNTKGIIEYEVIVRDSKLVRYIINFDQKGTLLNKSEL